MEINDSSTSVPNKFSEELQNVTDRLKTENKPLLLFNFLTFQIIPFFHISFYLIY